jgi:hypothetical protein
MIVRAKAVALFISIPLLLAAQSQSSSCHDRTPQNSANTNRTSPADSNSRPHTNVNGGEAVTVDKVNKNMSSSSKEKTDSTAEGIWGGPHVRLSMSEEGIQIEFDCAHGTINTPLVTDAQGRFDRLGTFVREGPGPIRVGRTPGARSARYSGRIEGKTMTLNVNLTEPDQPLGTYTLAQGSEGRLWKCR